MSPGETGTFNHNKRAASAPRLRTAQPPGSVVIWSLCSIRITSWRGWMNDYDIVQFHTFLSLDVNVGECCALLSWHLAVSGTGWLEGSVGSRVRLTDWPTGLCSWRKSNTSFLIVEPATSFPAFTHSISLFFMFVFYRYRFTVEKPVKHKRTANCLDAWWI
jgi:hypothetical protein